MNASSGSSGSSGSSSQKGGGSGGVVYVVLDGANVAFEKTLSGVANDSYNVHRLQVALDFFQQLQHQERAKVTIKCVAFAPNHWLNKKLSATSGARKTQGNGAMETDEWTLLQQLVDQRKVVLTPSHAHDDFYVIDYAVKHDGFIVTNDMFRDHITNEREFQGQKLRESWVKSHCIDFTFVGDEFLPNARAIERVLHFRPSPKAVRATLRLNGTCHRDEQEEMQEESMEIVMSQGGSTTATISAQEDGQVEQPTLGHHHVVIDADEMTPFKLPKRLFPMVFGEHGATLHEFERFTNTSVIFPCMKRDQLAAKFRELPATITLYIYGQEEHRNAAINHLRSFMMEQMQIQYQQQQMEIHQHQLQLQQQQQDHHQQHQQQYAQYPHYQAYDQALPEQFQQHPQPVTVSSQVDLSGESVQMMEIE